jgi:type I restriction enzyme S subunit
MSKWQMFSLDKVCTFENGDRGKNYPSRSAYVKEGIPFISAGNIKDNYIDFESLNYIPKERYNKLSNGKIKKGDILFCLRGSLGKFAHINGEMVGGIASSLVIIRPSTKIDTNYLIKYLESNLCQEMVLKYNNGAAQPNLSANNLKKFLIPLPPINIQKEIGEKLINLFDNTDNTIRLLIESNSYSKALMGSILDQEFTRLELTSKVVKISKIANIKGGKRLPKGEQLQDTKTDYPYIRVTDFNDNGSVDVEGVKYITKEIQSKISRYIITSDDLYISIAGTIGKTGIIPKELDNANLTENAARIVYKDKKSISNKFVYYYTKSDKFKAFVSEATKQVAQPKLALTRLNEIELALPSITEQDKAVEKFIKMENTLFKIEKEIQIKLNNIKALKNSLLDMAFKGKL